MITLPINGQTKTVWVKKFGPLKFTHTFDKENGYQKAYFFYVGPANIISIKNKPSSTKEKSFWITLPIDVETLSLPINQYKTVRANTKMIFSEKQIMNELILEEIE